MPYDFNTVPIAEAFKIDFFAMICKSCGATHPFYINHKGQPCFLTGFSEKAKDAFCEQYQVSIEDVVSHNCFVCHCGSLVRFPGITEEEKKADNKEKAAKLKQRGSGKRVISPKLTVVSEHQAKVAIDACEKMMKKKD